MSGRRWIPKRLASLAVGVAATGLICGLWSAGALAPLDRFGQNLHFRHFGSIRSDPRIVMIDINDHALDWVHRWPWPRRIHADLIRTLDELGALAIAVDIAFVDPTAPRVEHADLQRHWDVDDAVEVLGERSEDEIIFDDIELASAVAIAGNVYVAMLYDLAEPDVDPTDLVERAMDLIRQQPDVSLTDFGRRLSLPGSQSKTDLYQLARIAVLLEREPGLDEQSVSQRLGLDKTPARLSHARRLMARRAARRFLEAYPEGTCSEFVASVLSPEASGSLTPERKELELAYRARRCARLVVNRSPLTPASLKGRIPHGLDLRMPIEPVAKVAKGVGLVTYQGETPDGVLRDVPLLADIDGHLMQSLGFLVACDVAGVDRKSLAFHDGYIEFSSSGVTRRVPLSGAGTTLVNWHVPGGDRRWPDSFEHIPVTRVFEIAHNRRTIEENDKRLGMLYAGLVELRHSETAADYANYAELVRERNRCRSELPEADTIGLRRKLEGAIAELTDRIKPAQAEAVDWLRYQWRVWERVEPVDEEERTRREKIRTLYKDFIEGEAVSPLVEANRKLERRIDVLLEELTPRVEGRICFVGYTATAVADMVSTPIYGNMPGVMVHANLANMVLQNSFAALSPPWLNLLLIAVCGLLMTLLTSARGPWLGVASLAVVNGTVLVGAGTVFRFEALHLESLAACFGACVTWASVTLHRQSTEERAKRRIRRSLAQYTSPAVAAQIAERVEARHFSAQPARVACFFSDLQGFTPLSERLGAERTKQVLNLYLHGVSTVLIEHGAIVNKFIGDGIFAFYNAPILPCADHANAACISALDSQQALKTINDGLVESAAEPVLVMRIGLSTGEAFVGDYGSDLKLDYTCIGDTVNVGSRLEGAGKLLGTSILTDDETRKAASDGLLFRTVGRLRLAGKTSAVDAHELIGTAGESGESMHELAQRFEQAIRDFQAGAWDRCLKHLDQCRKLRPDDPVTRWYIQAVPRFRKLTLPNDWDGAIALQM